LERDGVSGMRRGERGGGSWRWRRRSFRCERDGLGGAAIGIGGDD